MDIESAADTSSGSDLANGVLSQGSGKYAIHSVSLDQAQECAERVGHYFGNHFLFGVSGDVAEGHTGLIVDQG